MRILLDECVPRRLKRELAGHTVQTVPEARWASIKNGALLKLAEASFDVFVTVDRGMRYQQNLSAYDIAVIVLVVRHNKFEVLQTLMPSLLEALNHVEPGQVTHIGSK
jgi:predicted nuclease of predicted toxin-antitoxin system